MIRTGSGKVPVLPDRAISWSAGPKRSNSLEDEINLITGVLDSGLSRITLPK